MLLGTAAWNVSLQPLMQYVLMTDVITLVDTITWINHASVTAMANRAIGVQIVQQIPTKVQRGVYIAAMIL